MSAQRLRNKRVERSRSLGVGLRRHLPQPLLGDSLDLYDDRSALSSWGEVDAGPAQPQDFSLPPALHEGT